MEYETQRQLYPDLRLSIGVGTIDPAYRLQKGEIATAFLNELKTDIAGTRFYTEMPLIKRRNGDSQEPAYALTVCVDGRGRNVGANAAGGTFSLVMADALSDASIRVDKESATDHAKKIYHLIRNDLDLPIGGHNDTNHDHTNSGCGAQDKLDSDNQANPSILRYIVECGPDIQNYW